MNQKILTKTLAIMLIITLTCANFILVAMDLNAIYAADFEYERQQTTINKTNVQFDSFFLTEDGKRTHTLVSEMENENLKLYLEIFVEKGYLSNGEILIKNSNFKLKEEDKIDGVEKISSQYNTIILNQINKNERKVIEIPIEVIKDEKFDINKFSTDTSIIFSGMFINDKAKETRFEKTIILNLSLSEDAKSLLDGKILKYAKFKEEENEKEFLQIEVESGVEENQLPIRVSEIEIKIPEIENRKLEYITVFSETTEATNGRYGNNINEDNYKIEDGKLFIKIENIKDENNIISWKKGTKDKFIINLVYALTDNSEEITDIELEIKSKLNLYNNEEKIIENEFNEKVLLEDVEDKIVSTTILGEEKISKGYMLLENANNTEFTQNIKVNIGYNPLIKEIDIKTEKETYNTEAGKEYEAKTYYKSISVNKENFERILGEEGKIIIKQDSVEIDYLDIENLEKIFDNEISDIEIVTSEPINDGILEIKVDKYIKAGEYYRNVVEKLTEIEEIVSIKTDISEETIINKIELADPTLQAKIEVNPYKLSTVTENENVEIKVVLQTKDNEQKLYKDPTIEIEFPSYIKNIKINSVNIFYDTELLPDSAELKINKNGNKALILKLKGEQTKYNENMTVEGLTILVNANIKVNSSAPSTTEKIISRIVSNNEEIEIEADIHYSAPLGIITLNTMSDYSKEEEVTSVSSEEQTGEIKNTSSTKIATETITVINNYDYNCGNMLILGRTPSEGNKNIRTEEDLGSTFTAKMNSPIKAVEGVEDKDIEVYYSKNIEATKDLEDKNNGWTKEPNNYEEIKSYLVVVNKELSQGEKVVLNYEIEIPKDLEKDESTYSMFEVYYTNLDGALNGIEEKTVSQVVGLATEQSNLMAVKMISDVVDGENVKEGQIIEYKVSVTNKGKTELKDVKVNVDIPEQASIAEYKYFQDIAIYEYVYLADKVYQETINSIKAGETKTVSFLLKVLKIEEGKENNIKLKATARTTVENEEQISTSEEITNPIVEGYFSLELTSQAEDTILKNGSKVRYFLNIVNNGNNTYNNIKVNGVLPSNLKYISSNYSEEDGIRFKASGQNLTIELDKLSSTVGLSFICEIQNLDKEIEQTVSLKLTGKCDELNGTIESKSESFIAGKATLEVTTTASNSSKELTDGDEVEYIITVKNVGNTVAYGAEIESTLTEGLILQEIVVEYQDRESTIIRSSERTNIITIGDIKPKETVIIKVIAKAVLDSNNKTIYAMHRYEITGDGILEPIQEESDAYQIKPIVYDVDENQETVKKYSISGLVWEDANGNGLREGNEKTYSKIPVKLLNKDGKTIDSNTTASNGTYTFKNLNKGEYIVAFEYDTSNFDVTKYKVGESSIDNDAIKMNLTVEGKSVLCAATNVFTLDENKSNIDLGLIPNAKFDLSLTKTIKKITVTTAKGTKSYSYNNSTVEKIEIPSGELNGATLAIEYEITVTNNGTVAGYAKRIVDYLSTTDLKFNSELNPDWYLGVDKNLYNGTLGDKLLKSGESKTLKLVLTKKVTEANTGITSNIAEIYEAYNDEGIKDYNSTFGNKAQTENDLGHAEVIISVKTGVVQYIGIVLFTIAILTLGVYIINKKVIKI